MKKETFILFCYKADYALVVVDDDVFQKCVKIFKNITNDFPNISDNKQIV